MDEVKLYLRHRKELVTSEGGAATTFAGDGSSNEVHTVFFSPGQHDDAALTVYSCTEEEQREVESVRSMLKVGVAYVKRIERWGRALRGEQQLGSQSPHKERPATGLIMEQDGGLSYASSAHTVLPHHTLEVRKMLRAVIRFVTLAQTSDAASGGGDGGDEDEDADQNVLDALALKVEGQPRVSQQRMCLDLSLVNTIFDIVQSWVNVCPAANWENAAAFMLPQLVGETLSTHRLAFHALTCIFSKNRHAELHFAAQLVAIPRRNRGDKEQTPEKKRPRGMGTREWGELLKRKEEDENDARPLEVANFVQAMVRQINAGLDVGATTCLLHLLDNNKLLLERTVNDSTVQEFKHLIDDNGPRPQYMNFFTAICSCGGQTVVSNQEEILRMMLLKRQTREHYFLTTR
jgi:hypothetical protein